MKYGNASKRNTWLCARHEIFILTSNGLHSIPQRLDKEKNLARIESTMSSIAIFSSVSIQTISSLLRCPRFEYEKEKNDYSGLRTGCAYRDVQPSPPSGRHTKATQNRSTTIQTTEWSYSSLHRCRFVFLFFFAVLQLSDAWMTEDCAAGEATNKKYVCFKRNQQHKKWMNDIANCL